MRKNYKKNEGHFALNITSMTDMFTLLLVFLLQSFAATSVELPDQNNLTMISSTSKEELFDNSNIVVEKERIKIGKEFYSTQDFSKSNNTNSELLKNLKSLNLKKAVLIIDENTEYKVTKKILDLLKVSGVSNIEFVNMRM